MDKNLEKLSSLYDGELSHNEMQEILKAMDSDEGLKNTFYRFGVISELFQRQSDQKNSKITDRLDQEQHDVLEYRSPETELMAAESESKIMQFIQNLDQDTKTAFSLREIEGRSYDEIAKILNCPIGTVRSRIFRARQLILEFMNQENIFNE